MGFPIGDFLALDHFYWQLCKYVSCLKMIQWLHARAQKKKQSNFIARIQSAEHFYFKRYSFEREEFDF